MTNTLTSLIEPNVPISLLGWSAWNSATFTRCEVQNRTDFDSTIGNVLSLPPKHLAGLVCSDEIATTEVLVLQDRPADNRRLIRIRGVDECPLP